MKDFRKELYLKFGRSRNFIPYYAHVYQEGNYSSFGAFGELLHDILLNKIDDHKLFLKQCAFIDEICSEQDPEWNNILRMEVFSIMNAKELLKLQPFLSADSNKQLEFICRKEQMSTNENRINNQCK